jgi:hypothetical protein
MPTVTNRGRLFWGSAWTARAQEGQLDARWLIAAVALCLFCGGCVSNCVSYSPLDPWAVAPATARTRQPCAS